jgi:hypothetical protein
MNIEDLKQDHLFHQLTVRQQKFVVAYVESRDHITSAELAYNCRNRHSARAVAGTCLRNTYVQAVIAKYSGDQVVTRYQFEAAMWKTIQSIKVLEMKKDLLMTFGKMKGYFTAQGEVVEPPITLQSDFLSEFKEV